MSATTDRRCQLASVMRYRWTALGGLMVTLSLVLVVLGTACTTEMVSLAPAVAGRNGTSVPDIDTLVFCPRPLQPALQSWVDYRQRQGCRIQVLVPQPTAFEVSQQIAAVATQQPQLKNLVLVGDANLDDTGVGSFVPTEYKLSQVTVKFGAEPEIATDNPYADIDGDGVPDLSVGRIPVDSAKELQDYIQRVMQYESLPVADWQSRVNLIAGVGGFGRIVDGLIEEVAKEIIVEQVPGHVTTSMTYGSWTSPYCPNPEQFSATAIERFNEGCLFWVYIGHGDRQRLDLVHMPDQSHRVLDERSVKQLACRAGNPITVFLACYTNSYDSDQDCLGERMLKQTGGPVAVIGGSRVTMPGGMGLLTMALLENYYRDSDPTKQNLQTLGQVMLAAKRELVAGQQEFNGYRKLIESVSDSLLPGQQFELECQDHVQLMQLLGDPLLRIKRPQVFDLQATQDGGRLRVVGNLNVSVKPDAEKLDVQAERRVKIQLCYQRDRLKQRFRRRRKYGSTAADFAAFQRVYDQSRDLVCLQQTAAIDSDGRFDTDIELPDGVKGRCVVVATVAIEGRALAGAAKLEIKKR